MNLSHNRYAVHTLPGPEGITTSVARPAEVSGGVHFNHFLCGLYSNPFPGDCFETPLQTVNERNPTPAG